MTLWNSEQELKDFASSGAHLADMKQGGEIAREICRHTYDADALPY